MPIYEYRCTDCGGEFEYQQRMSEDPKTDCETCGGTLERLISLSAFHLKGDGWYKDLYSSKKLEAGSADKEKSAASSDKSSESSASSSSDSKSTPDSTSGASQSPASSKESSSGGASAAGSSGS